MDSFLKSCNQQESKGRHGFELIFFVGLFVYFLFFKKSTNWVNLEKGNKPSASFYWLKKNIAFLNIGVFFGLEYPTRFLKTLETWENSPI